MFPSQISSSLTLPKVIGGISKTLNVANQLIPIYVQAKPMIQNAKSAFKVAKEIMATPNKKTTNSSNNINTTVKKTNTVSIKKEEPQTVSSNHVNNPVFFL